MTEDKKKFSLGKGCLIVAGAFVGLGVIGAIAGGGEDTAAPTKVSDAVAPPGDVAVVEPIENPADKLTGPQRNALRSAKQYLDMSGFSRKGLIQQLSSNAGDGYAEADAIVAVDTLGADWKSEAAESAKQYISMTGFSCKGLIQQLSSSAGDKYTKEEAEYGAKQAGAC